MLVLAYLNMTNLINEVHQVTFLFLLYHASTTKYFLLGIPLATGQNLAMGFRTWTEAVNAWIEEKEDYHYGHPSNAIVGHYTQVSTLIIKMMCTI